MKLYRAADNPLMRRMGYSAQYVADITFREALDTAGVIRVNIPAGGRTKAHAHQHLEELFIATSPMRIGVNDQMLELSTGDVVLVEPNETHWFEAPLSHDVTFIAIKLPNLKDDKTE